MQIAIEEIKEILKNKDVWLRSIRTKRQELYDALAEVVTELERTDKIQSDRQHVHTVFDVQRYKELLNRQKMELMHLLDELYVEESKIFGVWDCHMTLPEPYFTIIDKLYIKGFTYKQVEMESGYSHQPFENNRKNGLFMLQSRYEQDCQLKPTQDNL